MVTRLPGTVKNVMNLSRTINNAGFAQGLGGGLGTSIVGSGTMGNQMSNGNFVDDDHVVGLDDGLDALEERDDRDDEDESESGWEERTGGSPSEAQESSLPGHDR